MQITRSSIDTVEGPADWFTGDVFVVHWLNPVTDDEYTAAR